MKKRYFKRKGGNFDNIFDLVRNGDGEDLERFIIRRAGNVNLEVRDSDGDTPLIAAVIEGNAAMVGALLAEGADASARDIYGQTVLDNAERLLRVAEDPARFIGNPEDGPRNLEDRRYIYHAVIHYLRR